MSVQPIFALRGNSLNAIYAPYGEQPFFPVKGESNPTLISSAGLTGALGAQVIDVSNPSFTGYRGIGYPGYKNVNLLSGSFSAIIRIIPLFSGFPSHAMSLFELTSAAASQTSQIDAVWLTDGTIQFTEYLPNGNNSTTANTTQTVSGVANTAIEFQLSWTGVRAAGINVSVNGTLLGNIVAGSDFSFVPSQIACLFLGTGFDNSLNDFYIDEFLLFDAAMPTNYGIRVAYWPTLVLQPLSSTDPGLASVQSGTSYNFQGNAKTGTLLSTDPGVSHVAEGIAYSINSVPKTGTLLTGYTDPGIGNVLKGVAYEFADVPLTGTLEPASNVLSKATLVGQNAISYAKAPVAFTQGDTATLTLAAQDGNGNPINITGASFVTEIRGLGGVVVSFDNSQHTIIDAVNGVFQLALSQSDTESCGASGNKDIVTRITQGSTILYYRGQGILTVLPSVPVQ